MAMVRSLTRRVEKAPASEVAESAFYVNMEAPVPAWFWEFGDPSQEVLKKIHWRLRKGGWGRENIDTIYSFFEENVEPTGNIPRSQLRKLTKRWGEDWVIPEARFWVWLAGDYLVEHPKLLEDLPRLRSEGIISDWNISAEKGPMRSGEWGPGLMQYDYFVVVPG